VQSSRPYLKLHNGGVRDLAPPTAEQLRLGETNHPVVQARMRAVAAAVRAGTFRDRAGRSRPLQARHREVMWQLCAYADRNGEVRPEVITLGALAAELERKVTNVCADVRDLETALLITRRRAGPIGGPYVYMIPGMIAPAKPPK